MSQQKVIQNIVVTSIKLCYLLDSRWSDRHET